MILANDHQQRNLPASVNMLCLLVLILFLCSTLPHIAIANEVKANKTTPPIPKVTDLPTGDLTHAQCEQKPKSSEAEFRVTFINPDKPGNAFWDRLTLIMRYAAEDLNIQLDVRYAETRFNVADITEEVVRSKHKPDYIVFIYQYAQSLEALKIAEQAGVKSFMFNTNIVKQEQKLAGDIGVRFKHWIGHSYPSIRTSGQDLAKHVFELANAKNTEEDKRHYLLALHGSRDSAAAGENRSGLESAVSASPNVKVLQQLYSNWSFERARKQTEGMLRRHNELDVIWAGNESMALGALAAVESSGKTAGEDVFIAGSVSSLNGLDAIRRGKLVGNLGGDTLEGAWVLTRLYDYHFKHDNLAHHPVNYSLTVANAANIAQFKSLLDNDYWHQIDFKQFTHRHNKALDIKHFTPESLFNSSIETDTPHDHSAPSATQQEAINKQNSSPKS